MREVTQGLSPEQITAVLDETIPFVAGIGEDYARLAQAAARGRSWAEAQALAFAGSDDTGVPAGWPHGVDAAGAQVRDLSASLSERARLAEVLHASAVSAWCSRRAHHS